jgi:RimJ/RimL family protein N-acetyltransferase
MSVLATSRLRGRPCTADDAPHVEALFGDPGIRRWISPPGRPWTDARAGIIAARLAAHWDAHGWGQRLWFDADRLVGIAGLQFAILGGEGAVEAALAIDRGRQGMGYGREALSAVMAEAPAIATRIRAAVLSENRPSAGLLASLGFRPVGRLAEDGETRDILEWRAP